MRVRVLWWLLTVLALPVSAGEVRVAVASNFLATLNALQPLFEQQSGDRLLISAGSTGKLYAQISHGAPFDVLLSADAERPEKLEQDGLAVSGSRFTFARGRLSLVSMSPALQGGDCLAVLQSGKFSKLAIANPDTAPYGVAAQQTLQHLDLWEKYADRLIRGENIGQALQFVGSGNVELGFVARAQVASAKSRPTSCRWDVPEADHAPLLQQAVLLKSAADSQAAANFLRFLQSATATAQIERDGYGTDSH